MTRTPLAEIVDGVSELTDRTWEETARAMLAMNTVDEEHYIHIFVDLIDQLEGEE